jgi:hypothetical protein
MPKGKFLQLLNRGHMIATRDLEELIQEARIECPINDIKIDIKPTPLLPKADLIHPFEKKLSIGEWFINFFGDEE